LKCILNYFEQFPNASSEKRNQINSFERRCLKTKVDWTKCTKPLVQVGVELNKKIEESNGMLMVDFANKRVGKMLDRFPNELN